MVDLTIPSGKVDKVFALVGRHAQALGQALSHLLGGTTLTKLDLLYGDPGAPDALGEVLLGKVEVSAALLDPLVEGAFFSSHTTTTPHTARCCLPVYRGWTLKPGCTCFCACCVRVAVCTIIVDSAQQCKQAAGVLNG